MSEPFLLSGYAARLTDKFILLGDQYGVLSPFFGLLSRINNSLFFQTLVVLDFLGHSVRGLGEWAWSKVSSDPEHRRHAKMNYDTVQRCALGMLFAQATWIASDIVSQHFIPTPHHPGIVEHNGKLYRARAEERTPATIEEVQNLIREAKREGRKVAIVGAGMSQGKQALPPEGGLVINMEKLNGIEIDAAEKMAKVQAGVTWVQLQNEANKHKLAVKVQQASNVFSIGGSLSTNIHGWDHRTGPVGNTVQAMTIIDADGDLVRLTPRDKLFHYVLGGYGGFGVIIDAEIELADNEQLEEKGVEIAPADYLRYFHKVQRDPNIVMHLYRLSLNPDHLLETGIAVNYTKTGEGPGTSRLVDEPPRGNRLDRIKIQALRCLPWLIYPAWALEKSGASSSRIAYRNELMRPPINPVFHNSQVDTEWLQEFFVKEEDLEGFLKFLGKILMENKVPLYNASVRFVKQDDHALMGYASEGDRFAVVLFFNQSLLPKEIAKTKNWVQRVIDYLIQKQGTYYLPYQHFATREQFRACYPQADLMARYKDQYDPRGLFQNGVYQDYIL